MQKYQKRSFYKKKSVIFNRKRGNRILLELLLEFTGIFQYSTGKSYWKKFQWASVPSIARNMRRKLETSLQIELLLLRDASVRAVTASSLRFTNFAITVTWNAGTERVSICRTASVHRCTRLTILPKIPLWAVTLFNSFLNFSSVVPSSMSSF